MDIIGFAEGHLPFRYLGLPITTSRLTKGEWRILVDKITAKILVWTSRHISYVGRLVLVNIVLFGMFNFWAQVVIIPEEVVTQVIKIYRNFLWGGSVGYKRAPYVAWGTICTPKKHEGRGVACIAKFVWAIAKKKDHLWVQWIHGWYLKEEDWWEYTLKSDTSWY